MGPAMWTAPQPSDTVPVMTRRGQMLEAVREPSEQGDVAMPRLWLTYLAATKDMAQDQSIEMSHWAELQERTGA